MTDHAERTIRYFEDYVPGLTVDCGSFTLSEDDIIAFAKEYDPQPFHTDPVAAKDSPVGGLIASGWQLGSKMMRQLVDHYFSPESGLGAGQAELQFAQPVRPGQTLNVTATVLGARRSASKPDRGVLRTQAKAADSSGKVFTTWTAVSLVLLRNP